MADALTDFLVQDHHHAKLSPEMLELMGKQASNEFLEHGVSLNEAVVKLASQHPDVNSEQVKRVCEFANNATYLALHDKDKTAGSDSSSPHFDLADPSRVIQDMSDGARPTVITPTDVAYGQQPRKTKVSHPQAEAALADLFKTTTPDYVLPKEAAANEIIDVKDELKATRDHLSATHETFDLSVKQASAEFYETVKRHILEGNSLADVLTAVRSTGVDKEKISEVMTPVVALLLKEKVASQQKLTFDMGMVEKLAHRVVNQQHPLVTNFRSIVTSYNELEKTSAALEVVEEQLGRVNTHIRENYLERRSP